MRSDRQPPAPAPKSFAEKNVDRNFIRTTAGHIAISDHVIPGMPPPASQTQIEGGTN